MTPTPNTTTGTDSATPRDVAARLYAAIARGDTATVTELLHPGATLSVPGTHPLSGQYQGSAGLARFTAATATIAPGGAHTEVIDIMGGNRHAAVYGISRATRPDHPPLCNTTIHLIAVEDGRVTAVAVYNRDQPTVDAFWS